MYKRSKGVWYICLETETEKLSNARIILEDADGIFNLETGWCFQKCGDKSLKNIWNYCPEFKR